MMKTPLAALAAIVVVVAATTYAGEAQALTVESLEQWLASYGEAWESRSARKAGKIFTDDATYRESPYDAPFVGKQAIKDYWAGVTKDQKDIDFTSKVLAVSGDTGIAHWHAEFTQASSGAKVALDGIFVLEFAENGLCKKLEEWWHFKSEETAAKASE